MTLAQPPAKPRKIDPFELRRFRLSMFVVLNLCGVVLTMIFLFGDMPRWRVDRMNVALGLTVVIAWVILVRAMWRFHARGVGPGNRKPLSSEDAPRGDG
jgi:hypothetical protein